MSCVRFLGLAALVLALSTLLAQTGKSAEPLPGEPTCVIYSLRDLGDDPDIGKWVAETIPQVVEPGSWSKRGDPGEYKALHYYAPKKILVVFQTPTVHAKVEAFLKDLKKSLPPEKAGTAGSGRTPEKNPGVVPAEYREPSAVNAANAGQEPGMAYPVPTAARPPKHLFHFIIRYEGEGIVDENVVKFLKAQMGAKEEKEPMRSTSGSTDPLSATMPRPILANPTGWMKKVEDKDDDPTTEETHSPTKTKKDDKN
jgi:hypothetical protein